MTKQKVCVLKEQYTELLVDWVELSDESTELDGHYEFNAPTTMNDYAGVNRIIDFILSRNNPFSLSSDEDSVSNFMSVICQ